MGLVEEGIVWGWVRMGCGGGEVWEMGLVDGGVRDGGVVGGGVFFVPSAYEYR